MKIVVTEPQNLAEEVKQQLEALGTVVYGPFDDRTLVQKLSSADVLMVRLGRHVGSSLIDQAPKLRFILTASLDHVDIDAANRAKIRVISLQDCPGVTVDISVTAEHCFGLILALARRTPWAASHVETGGWDRDRFCGSQLAGKRLGIVGYGRIGAMVARYGSAFGMEILACDTAPDKIRAPANPVDLDDLLKRADVVTLHVSEGPENRHLIDNAAVARMKAGAMVINTAHGSVVDEQALAGGVSSGHLKGVAVDVLSGEGQGELKQSPLLACAREGHNVIITPHIGSATYESIARTERAIVERLGQFLATS